MAININYITGYAGTGKSTELIKLVNSLPEDSVIVLAPTHKALARLRPHLPEKVEIKTIHSFLGWIPGINEQASHINHIDITHKLDKDLEFYKYIIIDEAGMLSNDMLQDLLYKLENYDAEPEHTIYCFLDPYQLLPVKGLQIQIDPETTRKLTTQYRAESPDIVSLYTKFVHYLEGKTELKAEIPYSENVRKLNILEFKLGDRLLAYTNNAVGKWNPLIAKQLGITSYVGLEVQLGNMIDLVKVDDFINPDLEDLIDRYNANKLILQNTQINRRFLEASLQALLDIKEIQFIISGGLVYPVIVGIDKANQKLKQSKQKAIENKKHFKDVYALGRAFIMDYSFATTVHKSQGSEFATVFIDKLDIKKSLQISQRTYARLMYVALSRAKSKIYI